MEGGGCRESSSDDDAIPTFTLFFLPLAGLFDCSSASYSSLPGEDERGWGSLVVFILVFIFRTLIFRLSMGNYGSGVDFTSISCFP